MKTPPVPKREQTASVQAAPLQENTAAHEKSRLKASAISPPAPLATANSERMRLADRTPWQRRYMRRFVLGYVLFFSLYLLLTCGALLRHQRQYQIENENAAASSAATLAFVEERRKTATPVECGTYVEGVYELSLRNGTYSVSMEVWFSWEGDKNFDMLNNFRIYQGRITSMNVLRDVHENGKHYQRARIVATVQEDYWTASFPLDNHELFCYIESNYPGKEVLLVPDIDCSGSNPYLYVTGYRVNEVSLGEMYYTYENSHGDPAHGDGTVLVSEVVTNITISRDGFGLYIKCFIALVGTTTWVFIAMFINTYHHVDPLGMVPGALFGTVSNIMVGASLVPDSLQLGLLEYVNAFGILIILGVAVSIITVNRLRSKYQAVAFAGLLGRVVFWTLLGFCVAGNLLLPAVCVSQWAL